MLAHVTLGVLSRNLEEWQEIVGLLLYRGNKLHVIYATIGTVRRKQTYLSQGCCSHQPAPNWSFSTYTGYQAKTAQYVNLVGSH